MTAAVNFDGVTKIFPGVVALNDVSFSAEYGKITSLMGENGAGKSTLLSILGGARTPDEGRLLRDGKEIRLAKPSDAHAAGIGIIHKEPHVAPGLSVAENVFLGNLPARMGLVRRSEIERRCNELCENLGIDLDPGAITGTLGVAGRQMVEIVKALALDVKVLALDEPTSSLSTNESEQLFAVLEKLRSSGVALIYVSHRMEEVLALADAHVVLRDGQLAGKLPGEATQDELVTMMIGRDLTDMFRYQPRESGPVALELRNVKTASVGPVTLNVRRGEIVGVAGLVGAGRSRMVRALAGDELIQSGEMFVHGKKAKIGSTSDSIKLGLAICPEDRRLHALFPDRSVAENMVVGKAIPARLGVFNNRRREREVVKKYMNELQVRPHDTSRPVRTLSGGNAQKVVLARWLAHEPDVLVLDEPTRGIDIGAKSEIYELIRRLAAAGVAILVVSSELVELLGIADRIYVMRHGVITGELAHDDADEESILNLAMGTAAEAARRGAL